MADVDFTQSLLGLVLLEYVSVVTNLCAQCCSVPAGRPRS